MSQEISTVIKRLPQDAFTHIADVVSYFARNPDRLVAYVEYAFDSGNSMLAKHLSQLARMVSIPLVCKGHEVQLQALTFVCPKQFDNISAILDAARQAFGSKPVFRRLEY